MHRVFDRVVYNGRVLRTVFQMLRSVDSRKVIPLSERELLCVRHLSERGATVKQVRAALVCRALCSGVSALVEHRFVAKLLSASIGNDPSLRNILHMARPTPKDNARRAMFGWLTDKPIFEVDSNGGASGSEDGSTKGDAPDKGKEWAPAMKPTCKLKFSR